MGPGSRGSQAPRTAPRFLPGLALGATPRAGVGGFSEPHSCQQSADLGHKTEHRQGHFWPQGRACGPSCWSRAVPAARQGQRCSGTVPGPGPRLLAVSGTRRLGPSEPQKSRHLEGHVSESPRPASFGSAPGGCRRAGLPTAALGLPGTPAVGIGSPLPSPTPAARGSNARADTVHPAPRPLGATPRLTHIAEQEKELMGHWPPPGGPQTSGRGPWSSSLCSPPGSASRPRGPQVVRPGLGHCQPLHLLLARALSGGGVHSPSRPSSPLHPCAPLPVAKSQQPMDRGSSRESPALGLVPTASPCPFSRTAGLQGGIGTCV